jgi:hypothetical protein
MTGKEKVAEPEVRTIIHAGPVIDARPEQQENGKNHHLQLQQHFGSLRSSDQFRRVTSSGSISRTELLVPQLSIKTMEWNQIENDALEDGKTEGQQDAGNPSTEAAANTAPRDHGNSTHPSHSFTYRMHLSINSGVSTNTFVREVNGSGVGGGKVEVETGGHNSSGTAVGGRDAREQAQAHGVGRGRQGIRGGNGVNLRWKSSDLLQRRRPLAQPFTSTRGNSRDQLDIGDIPSGVLEDGKKDRHEQITSADDPMATVIVNKTSSNDITRKTGLSLKQLDAPDFRQVGQKEVKDSFLKHARVAVIDINVDGASADARSGIDGRVGSGDDVRVGSGLKGRRNLVVERVRQNS